LAFVHSGYINISAGSINNVSNNGYFWSQTAKSSTDAYTLYFYPTEVTPSGNGNRWLSRSLRCLYPNASHQKGDKFDFLQNFDRMEITYS